MESRRRFLSTCALVAAAMAGGFLTGCGSSSDSSGTSGTTPVSGGNCLVNGGTATVLPSGGHTHSAPTVSAADVSASTQKPYTLGTADGHSHTVTVSAANFTTLQGNQGIEIQTDADSTGHSHSVVINCA